MLKIALPNKGSLSEDAVQLIREGRLQLPPLQPRTDRV